MSVTIKTGVDATGFRAGLDSMRAEGARFRDSFRRTIEQGGGLFGAIDRGLGTLASGRFAAPIAAVGAALAVARIATDAMAKGWENMAASTERALQNIQAIEATRAAVIAAAKQGEALNQAQATQLRGQQNAASQAAAEADALGDPSTFRGLVKTANTLAGSDGPSLSGFYHFMMLAGGRLGIPGMSRAYDTANEMFNQRQQRAQETRQEADRTAQLRPFEEFANRTAQRSGTAAQIAAEDRLGVGQGRTTAFEAAANALLLANQQFEDTRRTFGDNDPRTQQARASALDAFSAYDSEITSARRFRNDPTIVADSLARLGGGGNVGVFGDGRGELLFEQKRLNTSIAGLTQVMQNLNVTLSRANLGGDVD